MRILLVSPGLPPDKTGGIENYVQTVRRELVNRGHLVTVLTQLHHTRIDDSEVIQVAVRGGEFRGYFYWAVNAWFKAISKGYDVAHFNGFPGQILSLIPLPTPKVVHVHNSLSMEPDWRARGGIMHSLGYGVASQAFSRASLVICPTYAVKDDVLAHSPTDSGKIRIIPNAVDTEFYKRENVADDVRKKYKLENKFVIIYFGKIKKTKGIETLCKAFYLLRQRIDAALIIGGAIPATDDFLQYLKKRYPEVLFTGFVDDPRPYYAAADVFSINTVGFDGGETFAISLAEAMSMGLPVVCSDNPIFREVTRENARFARPSDPASLAEELERIADDPQTARRMGRISRSTAESLYSVGNVVNRLEYAYAEAIER